jgi:hypothetical protein
MRIQMKTNDPHVKELARAAFPDYTGRKFGVEPFRARRLDSYWSGGSRSYFVLINIATKRHLEIPQNGSGFDAGALMLSVLPPGAALVEECIFCGRHLGLRVYLNPQNMTGVCAPDAKELSP